MLPKLKAGKAGGGRGGAGSSTEAARQGHASSSIEVAAGDRSEDAWGSKKFVVKTMRYEDMRAFMLQAERGVEETRMALESSKRCIDEAENALQQSVRQSAMWFVEKMQQSSKPTKQNKKKWVAVQAASFVLSLFFEIKRRAEKAADGAGEETSNPDMQEEATDIVQDLLLSVQEDKSVDEFLLMLSKVMSGRGGLACSLCLVLDQSGG